MAPNLFVCLRTVFCPIYWFQHGDRINGNISRDEHWDSPVPGTYRYIPGHGWHLVRRDDNLPDEKLPLPVVYCRILHRHLFEDDMDDRCQWHSVTSYGGAKSETFLFFRLDDGRTWVAGWDEKRRFIPGPYPKWAFDPVADKMYRVGTPPSSRVVSRCSSMSD